MRTPLKYFKVLMLIVFAASSNLLLAQQTNLLTLLEQSRESYPSIKAKLAEVKSASRELNASLTDYMPRVSVQHQYTYATSNGITGSFYPNPSIISTSGGIRATNSNQATWGSLTSAMVEWNVFNFGKVAAQVDASKANLKNSEAAYANEVFQHQVRVADAYLLSLVAAKLTSIQRLNVERALRFKQTVEASVRSGLRPGADSSLASAEYAKAQLLLLENQQRERAQQLQLFELVGLTNGNLSTLDTMSFFHRLPANTTESVTTPEQNPILQVYRSKSDFTMARATAIRRSFLPSVVLVGSTWARGSGVSSADDSFQTDFSSGTQYRVYNYLLGISTRWVISDLFSTHQRYKAEQFRQVRDEELYNEQSLKLNRQLNESNLTYNMTLEQARLVPVQVIAARHAFGQVNSRYKNGLTDLPTMLQSMLTLSRAEADMAIAHSNVWRSLLAVAAARGDLNIFLNAITNN